MKHSGNSLAAHCRAAGESRLKRPKTQHSAFVFSDARGILFVDYLGKGQTINSEYFIDLLDHLKTEIAKKNGFI